MSPSAWELWLALDPKNDTTAMWAEYKFGLFEVFISTSWSIESVYSIGESGKEGLMENGAGSGARSRDVVGMSEAVL
jgi:hypothetical protein